MLYYICDDGEMTLLFSLPCLASQSSVQTCGSTVYLSVKRYVSLGEIGMRRLENDTEEGTWRIDLKDGTKEKMKAWSTLTRERSCIVKRIGEGDRTC